MKQVCNIHNDNKLLHGFELQKTFSWSQNVEHDNPKLSGDKIYDFYIPLKHEIIIETHGKQHFEQCLFGSGKQSRTLQEEQENDKIKHLTALRNGIDDRSYIVLDCRRSTVEFIKNSIMTSNLPQLLNFTEYDIDWKQCNVFAASSRVYEACALWNGGIRKTKDVANKMKLHPDTVRNYLRRGEELGIVIDPPKHIKRITQQNN